MYLRFKKKKKGANPDKSCFIVKHRSGVYRVRELSNVLRNTETSFITQFMALPGIETSFENTNFH